MNADITFQHIFIFDHVTYKIQLLSNSNLWVSFSFISKDPKTKKVASSAAANIQFSLAKMSWKFENFLERKFLPQNFPTALQKKLYSWR